MPAFISGADSGGLIVQSILIKNGQKSYFKIVF